VVSPQSDSNSSINSISTAAAQQHHQYQQQQNIGCSNGRNINNIAAAVVTGSSRNSNSSSGYSNISSSRKALSTAAEQHYGSNSCFNINRPPTYVERLQYTENSCAPLYDVTQIWEETLQSLSHELQKVEKSIYAANYSTYI
jgi:hypothetical protein